LKLANKIKKVRIPEVKDGEKTTKIEANPGAKKKEKRIPKNWIPESESSEVKFQEKLPGQKRRYLDPENEKR
jgi:hypothetical protein